MADRAVGQSYEDYKWERKRLNKILEAKNNSGVRWVSPPGAGTYNVGRNAAKRLRRQEFGRKPRKNPEFWAAKISAGLEHSLSADGLKARGLKGVKTFVTGV